MEAEEEPFSPVHSPSPLPSCCCCFFSGSATPRGRAPRGCPRPVGGKKRGGRGSGREKEEEVEFLTVTASIEKKKSERVKKGNSNASRVLLLTAPRTEPSIWVRFFPQGEFGAKKRPPLLPEMTLSLSLSLSFRRDCKQKKITKIEVPGIALAFRLFSMQNKEKKQLDRNSFSAPFITRDSRRPPFQNER